MGNYDCRHLNYIRAVQTVNAIYSEYTFLLGHNVVVGDPEESEMVELWRVIAGILGNDVPLCISGTLHAFDKVRYIFIPVRSCEAGQWN